MIGVREVLLEVEEIVRGPAYESWRRNFIDRNIDQFEYGEENRLVYTSIHQEYEQQMENIIIKNLPPSMSYSKLLSDLPAYMEGPGAKDEAVGKAIQMLLDAGDFNQFREMMLYLKKQREEGEMKDSGDDQLQGVRMDQDKEMLAALDIEGMMETCGSLSAAADSAEWTEVLRNDWMSISKMAVPLSRRKSKNDIYLKGCWTMDLNFDEACDMMFSMTSRRKKWDSNFQSCTFPLGGSDGDDEVVTSAALNFGYLVNLVMFQNSKGMDLVCKNIRRWDVSDCHGVLLLLSHRHVTINPPQNSTLEKGPSRMPCSRGTWLPISSMLITNCSP